MTELSGSREVPDPVVELFPHVDPFFIDRLYYILHFIG